MKSILKTAVTAIMILALLAGWAPVCGAEGNTVKVGVIRLLEFGHV